LYGKHHGQFDDGPTVTLLASEHHRSFNSTTSHCFINRNAGARAVCYWPFSIAQCMVRTRPGLDDC